MTTSITTRAGKGSPLTHDEVDANFTNLQTTADGAETTANAALPKAGGTMTGPVTMTGGTVTTSTPLIDATQTWNASGVTFTGWKFNITNTASANGSKLFDLQYGGSTVMNLTYDAPGGYKPVLIVTSAANTSKQLLIDPENQSFTIQYAGSPRAIFNDYAVKFCNYAEGLNWSSSGTNCNSSRDTGLHRSAAGIVEINNGTTGTFRDLKLRNLLAGGGTVTTSTPLIDATQTWNAAGVTFTGWKLNVTDTASASGSKFAEFQISDTPIVWMEKSGAVVVTSPSDTNKEFRLDSASGGGLRLEYAGNLEARMSSSGVDMRSNGLVSWSSSAGQADSPGFTCIGRNADGVLEINNQTAGTFRDLKVRNLLAGGGNGSYVQTPSMTVANLAAAATAGAGARAFVTDATATTFLSTVAGGGSNKVPVVSDGTNWLIG